MNEIRIESEILSKRNKEKEQIDDDGSSDDGVESNIYEKKLNLVNIAHLLL